jgi:phosphinothricin acetyltransferase
MLEIRPAESRDLEAITEIYNHAILTTTATFDTGPKSLAEQSLWLQAHGPKYPVLVAEADGVVVAWASLSRWSDRCAYADTAELSLYVSEQFRGQGIGRKLSEAILKAAQAGGLHTVIARIAEGNDVSAHLCFSLGFTHLGTMREVGRKFGKLLDVHLFQIILEA